ncbi:MAG: metallophosphoesterase [Gracilibacteraceae bacterium]|jgi:hypothetical protein|nr:metallophosphoesterase [Gracilibacteraceae bacterium]
MLKTLKKIGCVALATALLLGFALTAPVAVTAEPDPVVLIDAHHVWTYEDSDTDLFGDPATDFRSPDYDATTWKTGPAPLGYPAAETDNRIFGKISDAGTLVANRTSPDAMLTYYLRTYFVANDVADIGSLEAEISFDDGYVLYLNGQEIDRQYVEGDPAHDTDATFVNEAKNSEGKKVVDLSAYTAFLSEGQNLLALSLHNRDKSSSDIYWGLKLSAVYGESTPGEDGDLTPRQVNVHVGNDAASEVIFAYTTVKSTPTKVSLTDGSETFDFTGTSSVGNSGKYFHRIDVSGLAADTTYNYEVGEAPNTFAGKFKTMPAAGSQDSFKFVYIADTQPGDPDRDGEALGATMTAISALDPDFVYLAGDITDTSTNEAQWESLFYNDGLYPTGGQDMFGNYLIAAIQGNHDNDTFTSHINTPSQEGKIVYTFDYGPMTFVMLNLEAARYSADARAKQTEFLTNAINEAKARGQWTAVGFHKSLYTGASHITDSDVIEARTYWCPKFAQLDVDFVLQGHDHVYSRGFVLEDGAKAAVDAPKGAEVQDPSDAPLYMIGGHAGGLKWYSMKNYTVTPGDPLVPGYAFLDVDSANPAHNDDNKGSDVKQEQVVVELSVEADEVQINAYMLKYDYATHTITTPQYLYDSLTIRRDAAAETLSAALSGPAEVNSADEIVYSATYNNLENANAFDTILSYDDGKLEFVKAESALDGALIAEYSKPSDSTVRLVNGGQNGVSGEQTVARFIFRLKEGVAVGGTVAATLVKATTVKGDADVEAVISAATVTSDVVAVVVPGDVNSDGQVTLADLALALTKYQTNDSVCDVDGSGVVDVADFIFIYNKYVGQ